MLQKHSFAQNRALQAQNPEIFKKKSLTAPDKHISPAMALKMYANKTLERQVEAYFSEGTDPMPDISRLSYLERLELQAEIRDNYDNARKAHQDAIIRAEDKHMAVLQEKARKANEQGTAPKSDAPK